MKDQKVPNANKGTIISRLDHPVYLKLKPVNSEKESMDSIVIPPRGKVLIKDFNLIEVSSSLPKGLNFLKESN